MRPEKYDQDITEQQQIPPPLRYLSHLSYKIVH